MTIIDDKLIRNNIYTYTQKNVFQIVNTTKINGVDFRFSTNILHLIDCFYSCFFIIICEVSGWKLFKVCSVYNLLWNCFHSDIASISQIITQKLQGTLFFNVENRRETVLSCQTYSNYLCFIYNCKNIVLFCFLVLLCMSLRACKMHEQEPQIIPINDGQSFNLFRCCKHTVQSLKLFLTITYFENNSTLYFDLISPWSGFHVRHNSSDSLAYLLASTDVFVRRYAVMLQFWLLYFF